ncbi:Hypothetical_protein [Hexamita inflata]|uniref:Hypothetical_protein n=1 Tax=Hexamita inflata TaxID=28002 RepID=A0AA86QL85_9EUKA|nr:Hypothetical protein HINF_LOCUS47938 [Hexamita inflata]
MKLQQLPKPLKQLSLSSASQSTCEPLQSCQCGTLFSTLCDTNELYEDSTEFALIDEKRLLTCKINDSLEYLKKSCKCIDKLGCKLQVIEQNIGIVKNNTKNILHNIVKLAK